MFPSKLHLALVLSLLSYSGISTVEAQGPPISITCDPISGSYQVHISFIDVGAYGVYEVTVNGIVAAILPPAGTGLVVKSVLPLRGPGGHVVCVQGLNGPLGQSPLSCCQFSIPPTQNFVRGDANADGSLNIADVIKQLALIFGGAPVLCLDAADANDDGFVDIADPIHLLTHILGSGPPPSFPYPMCGPDPTVDGMNCVSFPPCP
ncbi:MAG: dockerin type I repeat-containing protein [Planctomycetota bacterium]